MGLSDSVTLSFMVVGHTKFTPDSCFGLLKQRFRKCHVQTLQDMADVVTTSATCNNVEVVGWEDGVPIIPTYDWASYFAEYCNKITGIKQYHHFTCNKSNLGKVLCKEMSDSTTVEVNILKKKHPWKPTTSTMPPVIKPKGLDAKRRWYLYEKIRPYCHTDEAKDRTCPLPSCPRECDSPPASPIPSSPSHPLPLSSLTSNSPRPPPSKKQRICGNCHEPGHNARTCKN